MTIYTNPFYNKIPYHTLALSGVGWVCKSLNSHLGICNELGVYKHAFHGLTEELKIVGHGLCWNVYLEQLTILQYTCTTDSTMFEDAHIRDLSTLCRKYYIADASFPICESLIIPYQGECYHLTEWGHAQLWYISSCIFWLMKNTLSPPTKLSYLTANIHLHAISLNIYLVSKNTTSRFCYIYLRSP